LSLRDELASIGDPALRRGVEMIAGGEAAEKILTALRQDSGAVGHGHDETEGSDRGYFLALALVALQAGYPPRVIRKLAVGFGGNA
jgi:hypothetical protein